jgi:hypothetical protein
MPCWVHGTRGRGSGRGIGIGRGRGVRRGSGEGSYNGADEAVERQPLQSATVGTHSEFGVLGGAGGINGYEGAGEENGCQGKPPFNLVTSQRKRPIVYIVQRARAPPRNIISGFNFHFTSPVPDSVDEPPGILPLLSMWAPISMHRAIS